MNETNPYAILGVELGTPFEEVKTAKDRLLLGLEDNDRQRQVVEAAYDAILMQRLQLRKEGKVKVPDRIRFPEAATPAQPAPIKAAPRKWWTDWLDQPTPNDLLRPGVTFGGLGVLSFVPNFQPGLILSLALMGAVYFLFQKSRNFLRAFGLALAGLLLTVILGYLLVSGQLFPTIGVALILALYLAWVCYLK